MHHTLKFKPLPTVTRNLSYTFISHQLDKQLDGEQRACFWSRLLLHRVADVWRGEKAGSP
jgi:hypothetical protein